MKRIVVCCDGTWNEPDQTEGGVPTPTNVARFAQAIKPDEGGVAQMMFYHPGVGASQSWFRRLFDGYTGTGVSQNILEAYRFIVAHYAPSDQLYLLGFSRGAFTVRSLAGLIRTCGVLRRDAVDPIDRAFALYRARRPATHPREREATLFRRTYAVADVTPIHFIGVWDTVGSLGNPLVFGQLSPHNRFHDTDLSTKVRYAYQALAIDEKRRFFKATLWHQQEGAAGQTLEQAWFPGVHSNVGGGYADSRLADVALEWLVGKAQACGLGVSPFDLTPDPLGVLKESRKGLYRLLAAFHRPIDRPDGSGPTNEFLHPSVAERYRQDPRYRPKNLLEYYAQNPSLSPSRAEPL